MRLLRFLFQQSRPRLVAAAVSGFASGIMTTGLVVVINLAINPQASRLDAEQLTWAFAVLLVAAPGSRLLAQYLLVELGQGVLHDLRMSLSRRLARTPLERVEELRGHRLLATLTDDVNALGFAVVMLPALSVNLAIVLGCLGYMGWLSWPLLVGFLLIMGVGVVTYRAPIRKGGAFFAAAREDQDALMGRFETLIDGNKELKLHGERRAAFFERLGQIAGRLRAANVRASLVFTAANSWGWTLFFLILGLLLFGLPRVQPVDRAALTGYVLVILYLRSPMQLLLDALPQLSRGGVALAKIESLGLALDREQEGGEGVEPTPPAGSFRRLALDGVRYSYRGDDGGPGFALGPLDLAFEAGETVFLVGGNGSGKTTLAKVLTGLYLPDQGRLTIDGQAVAPGRQEDYRRHFSVVFSSFFLFDELLGLAAEGLDERARAYLEVLGLGGKVTVTAGRLSTTDLSHGQRKRLALLTAYLEDRPIYLFDEWAADQDPHFKRFFYRELLPELKVRGKTLLVISHDDAYFDAADRMVKLEHGRVVYDGPPVVASLEVATYREAGDVGAAAGS